MKLSVIIPVKNGAATLDLCLQTIRQQTISDIEIILLDSMSDDDSKLIGLKYGATIIDIPTETFNHGLTRNTGVQHASGDLIYFTVQDAWIAETDMLEKMVSHFNNEDVGGVYGHQAVPWGHIDKNPAFWFKRYSKPVIEEKYFPNDTFRQLSLKQQFHFSSWDNVNAMYRKTALLKVPFRSTNYSEDWFWANDALAKSIKLLYDPSLIVYHYHHQDFSYRFKSQFTINYYFFKYFKIQPSFKLSPLALIRPCYTIIKRKEISILKKPGWIIHNVVIYFADFLSTLFFKLSLVLGDEKLLEKTYIYFCKKVPQGKINY